MKLKLIIILFIPLTIVSVVLNKSKYEAARATPMISTNIQDPSWTINTSLEFPFWIGFSQDHVMGKFVFIYLEPSNFTEENLRKIFSSFTPRYEPSEDIFITLATDQEIVKEEIEIHLSPTRVKNQQSVLIKSDVTKKKIFFRADYSRVRGTEKFTYTLNPEIPTFMTVSLKEK